MTEAKRRAALEAMEALNIAMLPLLVNKPDMRAVIHAADALGNVRAAVENLRHLHEAAVDAAPEPQGAEAGA